MKCAICKKKTTMDKSFGYNEFIVCYHCFDVLRGKKLSCDEVMNFIFKCGRIRKENVT